MNPERASRSIWWIVGVTLGIVVAASGLLLLAGAAFVAVSMGSSGSNK